MPTPVALPRRMINTPEVSRILGIHPQTVHDWARKGILPGVRIGKFWKFDADLVRARLAGRDPVAPAPIAREDGVSLHQQKEPDGSNPPSSPVPFGPGRPDGTGDPLQPKRSPHERW